MICLILKRTPFCLSDFLPYKHQPHKMVQHNQTIRQKQATNCLSVFDHFVGLTLKGLTVNAVINHLVTTGHFVTTCIKKLNLF